MLNNSGGLVSGTGEAEFALFSGSPGATPGAARSTRAYTCRIHVESRRESLALDLSSALKTSCEGLYPCNFVSAIATQHDTHTQHDRFIGRSTACDCVSDARTTRYSARLTREYRRPSPPSDVDALTQERTRPSRFHVLQFPNTPGPSPLTSQSADIACWTHTCASRLVTPAPGRDTRVRSPCQSHF